ncbi:hypothetical protein RHSIM_Rhsim11G0056800 [Rhododendron simsii]|uniref:SLL1 protein n=1 Tax=Rhododendron simsii TaxID=118357 RepID=A0A834LBS6_RHOSS|nr:hypothetical protein RHSIM_Rhsim11G0056800 [Rhododendron simsii]
MASNNMLRSCASKLLTSTESFLPRSVFHRLKGLEVHQVLRCVGGVLANKRVSYFHSTGVKRMGGAHAHGHDEPYYMHAKHMYNLDRMKHQKLTMSLAVLTAFSIGAGVPVFAVVFQQKKTASG